MSDDLGKVIFQSELGDIEFTLHPEWDTPACDRFIELVNAGFYNGAPWFRVVPNFVIQCGISSIYRLQRTWCDSTFQDSPVVMGNRQWSVAYGKTNEPNSRNTHVFINLKDNYFLDSHGFSAFAEITNGFDVINAIVAKAGDEISGDQERMNVEGTDHLKEEEPWCDALVWIERAYLQ